MGAPIQLGDYQLLEKLGEGGMGAVYKALHTKLKRTVAIKILPKDRLWDEHAVARFEREMAAVGALDHPNIVRPMDAREMEGTRFLVMEYVDGLDVNTLGRACHPLPIADACEIVRQAALGLQHAHEHELVHRDVKPSNLMVTPQGVVKLLDLGLARFEHDQAVGDEVTGTGQAMGTVDYMAPEQVSDARSVDIRADIYSLGCTFYKLLCGQTPFGGLKHKSAAERLVAHLREPVPPIRRLRADVPDGVVRMLGRMLAKEPLKRFAAPAEVADAVGPFAAGSDLAALVARAQGQPSPAPAPTQSMMATQELGSSSGLTRFLRQIVGQSGATVLGRGAGKRGSRRPVAIVGGALVVSVVCLAALLMWAFRSAGPGVSPAARDRPAVSPGVTPPTPAVPVKTFLVLQWPSEERQGAMCELDGQPQDMDRLELLAMGGEINLPVTPGEHKLVMKRLGYEPFEHSFTVVAGKDVPIRPSWKEVASVAQPPSVAPTPDKQPMPPAGQPPTATAVAKEAEKKPPAAPAPQPSESPEAMAARKRLEALDARYADALEPVEKLAAAWDFRGAAVALGKVRFGEPELTARLAQRRDELKRMHDLKQKIVAAINAAQPPLKRSALGIKGMGGEVVKADDHGLTCKLINGKSEGIAWVDLGPKAVPNILQLVIDRNTTDDWLAGALIALVSDDVPLAEKCFEQARSLGTNIDRYLTPLASAAFARAKDLLEKKEFSEAEAALASLEAKYVAIPWFATYKQSVESAGAAAKSGIHETEAEKLYTEAAGLFAQKEFFDLKPLVEKLKSDHPTTAPITDTRRKPSFAELEKAVANLGRVITVRQDGKGNFATIQEAVNAAKLDAVIEIQDCGPYAERVEIPKELRDVTIRGSRGCWPVITSSGARSQIDVLLTARGTRTTLHRVVLAYGSSVGTSSHGLVANCGELHVRLTLLYSDAMYGIYLPAPWLGGPARATFDESIVIATIGGSKNRLAFTNCVCLGAPLNLFDNAGAEIRRCTAPAGLFLGEGSAAVDSIVKHVACNYRATESVQVRFSNIMFVSPTGYAVPYSDAHADVPPGTGCIRADPKFRDPANLDYRLMPGSPCIGKASDGGDIGCRYTPEMIELCKVALELRRKGIIKF